MEFSHQSVHKVAMRPLRRRASPLFPPVVETDWRRGPPPGPRRRQEIATLQQEEREWAESGLVIDWVVYRIISEPRLDNGLKNQLYRAGIKQFADRVAADEVRALIDVAIKYELIERAERIRRAEAARKAQSGAAKASMLQYRLRAAGLTA